MVLPAALVVKNPQVQSLGGEECLEEGMATQSSILAWRIPVDRGAWWATFHGVTESDATEHTCSRFNSAFSVIVRVSGVLS